METEIWCPIARQVCNNGILNITHEQTSLQQNVTYKFKHTLKYTCKAWDNGKCLLYYFLKCLNEAMTKPD